MKHPMTSQWNVAKTAQWYVSTTSHWYVVTMSQGDIMTTSHQYVSTSQSYIVATPCLYYGVYYVFKLLCHDLQLVGFHISFKHRIKHHIVVPTRSEKRRSSFHYKLVELLLHLKNASYINNICNIFCVDIYF